MATTKVSALAALTSPDGSEELLVNDGGTSKKLLISNLPASTPADDSITYAKIQNVSATDRVLGRDSSGAGDVEEITPANLRTMINVEDGATADQSNAEIKTAYEANSDTNAFTDADHSKLDGIEASADVTDTANVTSAGALMDSEVTNLAQVKAFDSSDYATAAQGTTADAALPKTGGAMTGAITTNSTFDGRDVATDGTKLDGIEASADVTDTANVTAAGALMDSEVTNLAQVKAFSSADYATAAQGTTADSALQNVSEDSTPQLGGNLDVNGNSIVSASNGDISITPNGTGDVIIDGLKHPQADGTSGQVLQTNGSGQLSFANAGSGKVKQITTGSDATLYAISTTNATSDHAGSIAYSITPTSSSSKIMIHFTIPQVKQSIHAGVRMRVYRQIGGGGYSHVTGLSGTAASNRQAAVFGNYDTNGDGNRAATTMTGTLVDSPATTSQVDYKFYFGTGDGASTVYVNRTQNDTDLNYTHRTRTHCTLVEIET